MPTSSSLDLIKIFNSVDLESYLQDDTILKDLQEGIQENDHIFTSHQWLLDSAPKRMIFKQVYGDLLRDERQKMSILDVGGGLSSLSQWMLKRHDYQLLDIMAHDSEPLLRELEKHVEKKFWINQDWYTFQPQQNYDCIVANDIFPNVDQRLELFLEKYLPCCRELRMTVTFYNEPRFYPTKRLDGDEVLYFLAWSGSQVQHALAKYFSENALSGLSLCTESLFPNKRIVASMRLPGHA